MITVTGYPVDRRRDLSVRREPVQEELGCRVVDLDFFTKLMAVADGSTDRFN
jgi:hypothetical protein